MNSPIAPIGEGQEEEPQSERPPEPEREHENMMERMIKTRNVLLCGEIDKSLAEKVIRQLMLMSETDNTPIKLFIDSPGGDADAGYAIFDMIRFIEPPVYTIGMGLVASAGALVLLATPKEQRIGLPNSHYLIHQPLSGMRGAATDIEIHAKEIERMRLRINTHISKETGKSLKQVEKDTDRDYWMAAEEAQTYGLIARIIENQSQMPPSPAVKK